MKKTSSEHYCFIFSNIYQNNYNIGSVFPPTSGQILPTSGFSDWPKWDPHMANRFPYQVLVGREGSPETLYNKDDALLYQSATLAAGPGPEASEKLTRASEIYIKLLRASEKNPNFAHFYTLPM